MDVVDDDRTRLQLDIQRQYVEFLDDSSGESVYYDRIKEMIRKNESRLLINVNDLRTRFPQRCSEMLQHGFDELPLVTKALREVVSSIDSEFAKDIEELFIGLEGSFGTKHVTPRTLSAHFLGNTVCIEGIVTKCSVIRPKVVRSVHYCPTTKKSTERRYTDLTSFDTIPSVNMYPTKDEDGNLLETEYGLSKYRDHQTITIQEMPEKAPTGQLPRSVDIILDNDLVDTCKPGDRILAIGVYRCLPAKQGGYTTGIFRTVLVANQITMMSKEVSFAVTREDLKECKAFAKSSHAFEILARSLAPTIHGHEYIKKAILCLLLGGVEKLLPNGTRLRGDINVLLIGDPSVAKSQMLRYVSNVAPRVVMTTGRGSSGVGLTAAVTNDMETGDRRLEAGAMVLADRGIVCIDEFDKMSDVDRTAIHEVMEQGRVTIAKAGIHATLNARTAVLAAANPVYGRYDRTKSPMENIALQDSLLSRFDLLFIVLDTADPEQDRAIADHVLRIHRYRNPTEQDGEATPLFQKEQTLSTQDIETEQPQAVDPKEIWEKHNDLLHGPAPRTRARKDKVLSIEFMKKYINLAKLLKPKLTTEAGQCIAEKYGTLRAIELEDTEKDKERTQPITARSLETMIRLATAHAKARMSKDVTKEDALVAIELVEFAYFERVLKARKKRKKDDDDYMEVDENDEEENAPSPAGSGADEDGRPAKKSRTDTPQEDPSTVPSVPSQDDEGTRDSMDMDSEDTSEATITDERYKRFMERLSTLFQLEREQSLSMDKITDFMENHPQDFTKGEVRAGIKKMQDEGKVVHSEGIVFII